MKVLAWINMVFAALCELYLIAALPDVYGADERFYSLFAIGIFAMFLIFPALFLFAKKK